jgi:hypothetical protein
VFEHAGCEASDETCGNAPGVPFEAVVVSSEEIGVVWKEMRSFSAVYEYFHRALVCTGSCKSIELHSEASEDASMDAVTNPHRDASASDVVAPRVEVGQSSFLCTNSYVSYRCFLRKCGNAS